MWPTLRRLQSARPRDSPHPRAQDLLARASALADLADMSADAKKALRGEVCSAVEAFALHVKALLVMEDALKVSQVMPHSMPHALIGRSVPHCVRVFPSLICACLSSHAHIEHAH